VVYRTETFYRLTENDPSARRSYYQLAAIYVRMRVLQEKETP
jgi:hypothetical protein